MLHVADKFAERMAHEAGDDPRQQIDRAYRLAYAPRRNGRKSRRWPRRWCEQHGLAMLARAIFNSNEFMYVD